MGTSAVAVLLSIVVVFLVRVRQVGPLTAFVCIALGMVLSVSPIGAALHAMLNALGGWLWGWVTA